MTYCENYMNGFGVLYAHLRIFKIIKRGKLVDEASQHNGRLLNN